MPSCRLASLRRSLMEPRLRTSRSPASPRPCSIPGVSRSGASDCDVAPATHARRHRSRRRNRLKQTPNQRQPSRSRNASYVGQRVYRSCGLRAGVRLTLQGSPANRSLSAIEPVSAPPKGKLKNGNQRPAPKTRPARTEIRKITDQRLGSARVTHGNVGDSPQRGNKTPETGLPG